MAKEKRATTNSRVAVAIGFFAAIALQGVMVVAYLMTLPFWLPVIILLGLTLYVLREKILSVLLGFGIGTVIILTGLFSWLTVNGLID